ncbi:MAG: LpxI family protein [Thermodesulfobacteriota bacterium]
MNSKRSQLGLVAGKGQFPFLVVQGAKKFNRSVKAVGFKGHTSPELFSLVDEMTWINVGQLGKMIKWFKKRGIREVVFAGGIDKPRTLDLRPDFKAAKLLYKVRNKNDNALLQAIVETMQQEGLEVVSPIKFIPGLLAPIGTLTRRQPSKQEEADIAFGWPLAKEIGRMDIGQCIVVKENMVVAVEAIEGTDATIKRAGELAGEGCTVIKVFKPEQEEKIDQPAIGVNTIETMKQANVKCLAMEAGKSLFFDQEQSLALANRADICIIGYETI